MSLKLVTYNIHSGIGTDKRKDYRRINNFLENIEADIVLLQEVRIDNTGGFEDVKQICGTRFKHFLPGKTIEKSSGWYGNAILSRFPITNHKIVDISQPGRQPRCIIEAFIDTPDGRLHVLNTHKGLRSSERKSQLKRLHSLLVKCRGIPMVVGGDINEWHTSSKALKDLNSTLTPIPVGATFPTRFPIFPLDRIWCRPEHVVKEAQVIKTKETKIMSDHFPVSVTIDLLKASEMYKSRI